MTFWDTKKKLRKFVANRFTVKGIIEGPSDKMEKEMATTPVNLPGEFHGQRKLAGYSPWGCRVRHDWATITQIKGSLDNNSEQHKEIYFG